MQLNTPADVKTIIEKLQDNGYEAYAVGGCVRDSYLGLTPHDWDITTSALPLQVKELFNKTLDVGIQHGTVVVMIGSEGYEVTTYRIDGEYEDNRHPQSVVFTDNLREDLRRRDFTINAMAYSDKTGIIDLFGGIEDLSKGVIRAVGDPKERFSEDALRMFRAIRFSAKFKFDIEENTQEAIKELAPNLATISCERIRDELQKTIVSDNPDHLRLAYNLGVTRIVLPEFDALMECEQNSPYHYLNVGEHTIEALMASKRFDDDLSEEEKIVLRLAILLHDVGKPQKKTTDAKGVDHFKMHPELSADMAEIILRRLKYDNKTIEKVCKLVLNHDYRPGLSLAKVRRAVAKIGPENMKLLNYLKYSDFYAQSDYLKEEKLYQIEEFYRLYEEVMKKHDCLYIKDLKISGRDLIEVGFKAGPELGDVLKGLLDDVINNPSLNEKEVLVERALKIYRNKQSI